MSQERLESDKTEVILVPRILPTLLVFLGLSLVLISLILAWGIRHSRFSFFEYSLALVELSIGFLLLVLTYFFLRRKLVRQSRELSFRWAVLLLVPALASLLVCFNFLAAIPTDGDEGWAIIFSSLFYPVFVLFSSQFFLIWDTERQMKKIQLALGLITSVSEGELRKSSESSSDQKRNRMEERQLSQEAMENIASIFGFTRATPQFDRWVTKDGCKYSDVASALAGSRFTILADWQDDILDVLEDVKRALSYWKLKVSVEPDPENVGIAILALQSERIELSHQVDEGWYELVLEIQKHLPQTIEIREAVDNGGSDTEEYVLLLQEEWLELERIAGDYFVSRYRRIT